MILDCKQFLIYRHVFSNRRLNPKCLDCCDWQHCLGITRCAHVLLSLLSHFFQYVNDINLIPFDLGFDARTVQTACDLFILNIRWLPSRKLGLKNS